jgi:hypothetical protein
LKKEEAVEFLKEVSHVCNDSDGTAVSITPIRSNKPNAEAYQLTIRGLEDRQNMQCIRELAKKHDLVVDEERNIITIHDSKT